MPPRASEVAVYIHVQTLNICNDYHMVQRRSPEGQYQQKSELVVD